MNRAQKQHTVIEYLMSTKSVLTMTEALTLDKVCTPRLTVGETLTILSKWEHKLGNVVSVKG